MDLTKYPINERGFTVIPCIRLVRENMTDDLIGLHVTIGLSEVGIPTSAGIIKGYDDENLKLQVGNKVKNLPYDPENIQLQVYQFAKMILFSNTIPQPPRKEIRQEKAEAPTKPETKKGVKNDIAKPKSRAKKTKKVEEAKKPESKRQSFGIVWEN